LRGLTAARHYPGSRSASPHHANRLELWFHKSRLLRVHVEEETSFHGVKKYGAPARWSQYRMSCGQVQQQYLAGGLNAEIAENAKGRGEEFV
jgi:hypothetical protein